jgi:hypothetical protein
MTTEEYYIERDEFISYIIDVVNPARASAGLEEIREYEARECFRIIKDFDGKLSVRAERLKPKVGK